MPQELPLMRLRCGGALAVLLWAGLALGQESSPWPRTGREADSVPLPPRVHGTGGYGVVPGPPRAPIQTARPTAWPSGPGGATDAAPPEAYSGQPGGTTPEPRPFERARIIARVGSEAILVADVLATLDERLERNADKAPPEQLETQRKVYTEELLTAIDESFAGAGQRGPLSPEQQQRRSMLQALLMQQVQTKLMYYDARRKIPSENFPHVEKQLTKQFEQLEVPHLKKQLKADSWRDLDQALRARGSSYERQRQAFIEQAISRQWLRQQVKFDNEVTFDQMLTYYRDHPGEFDLPQRTRWQELAVSFSQYPGKAEAYQALVAMGNRVLDGADPAEVARSGGSTADGAVREWPEKKPSRLITPAMKQAIEGLPAGGMSPILEDWQGLHIIRVVERLPAGRVPFETTQGEIREKVKLQRTEEQTQAYVNRLKQQIPVWTILDSPAERPQFSTRARYPTR